jgi:hypothetical protein
MLSRVLKMSFWVSYDHLGKLLVANICCALFSAVPLVLGASLLLHSAARPAQAAGALLLLAGILFTPALFAGLLHFVKICIDTGDAGLTEFFAGVRLYLGRAVALGMAYALLGGMFTASAWFYPTRLQETAPLVGYFMGIFSCLALAVLALSALYVGPALVNRPTGPAGALQLAVTLVLDKPFYTLALAVAAGGVAVLAVAPPWLAFSAYAAMAVLLASAYEILAQHYGARAAKAAGDTTNPHGTPAADYLNRGWSDLLHPWKS